MLKRITSQYIRKTNVGWVNWHGLCSSQVSSLNIKEAISDFKAVKFQAFFNQPGLWSDELGSYSENQSHQKKGKLLDS